MCIKAVRPFNDPFSIYRYTYSLFRMSRVSKGNIELLPFGTFILDEREGLNYKTQNKYAR